MKRYTAKKAREHTDQHIASCDYPADYDYLIKRIRKVSRKTGDGKINTWADIDSLAVTMLQEDGFAVSIASNERVTISW